MTRVIFTENNEHITLCITGHSGYAESGADIVCSAISILTHAFCEYITQLNEEDKIQIHALNVSDGLVNISYDDVYGFTLSNLKLLEIGFYALEEQYKKYITVEWGEIDF